MSGGTRPLSGGSRLTVEPGSDTAVIGDEKGLRIVDPASIADEPPIDSYYRHRVSLFPAIRAMAKRHDILFTLIFGHVKSLKIPGVPYAIYAYIGILAWVYFSGSLSSGGNSMIANLNLLQKTHFPRECFPLSQMLEQTLYTTIGVIPLVILFVANGFTPKVEALWIPVFLIIEVMFTAGLVLAMAALVVYLRDLQQVMSIILQLGLFATPIIWPLSKLSKISWGPLHHVDLRPYYVAFNPLGAVIDNIRRTALLGLSPEWSLLGIAAISACVYFVIGYRIFKRLEVGFADIS
jgi:ABC-type polysaccharide/polyol phosphate export permease